MELYLAHRIDGKLIYLDKEESHHCIKVMRHRKGDLLEVTDGKGKKYSAIITEDNRQECVLEMRELLESVEKNETRIHLAIAPTKSIDRFEWLLEKITEIGIDEITPVICQRSERNLIKPDRLNKLLLAAMKQSLRWWLPKLNDTIKFKDFIKTNSGDASFGDKAAIFNAICHCQRSELPLLKRIYQPKKNALILIGPEGDFTLEEINLAEANGFVAVSLSSARLRTETAGIVAVHTLQLLND